MATSFSTQFVCVSPPLPSSSSTPPRRSWPDRLIGLAPGLLALLAPSVGRELAALAPSVDAADAYLLASPAALLYVRMPLAVLGAVWLVLAPGDALARAFGLGRSRIARLPFALLFSIMSLAPALWTLQFALDVQPDAGRFVALALLLALACEAHARGGDVDEPGSLGDMGQALAAALTFAVALTPKFFFECFNGDGAHAFEASRLLLHRPLPFWPDGAGDVMGFPGLNSALFTYPNAWFLWLFGPCESAVRLPFLLELLVLHGCLVTCCEQGAPRKLPTHARALIGLGVISFGLIMAYSATYDPYCADIALPATQDTLTMIVFFGTTLSYLRGSALCTFLFAAATLLASPNGLLLLALWWLGMALSFERARWARWIRLGLCVAGAVALYVATPALLAALGAPVPGSEHSGARLLDKFRHLQLWDPQRFVFLILPAGIYPMLGYFAWRRVDAATRAWIVVTAGVFGMFYVLAASSLHYFVPVMLIPLIVFWRGRLFDARAHSPELPRGALAGCALGALASIAAATPASLAISTSARQVGASIRVIGIDGYARCEPSAFLASDLLARLYAPGWNPKVPEEAYAGSSLAWNFYAQSAQRGEAPSTYELRGTGQPASDQPFAQNAVASLFVRDEAQHARFATQRPLGSLGRALYMVPRAVLFGRREALERPGAFNLGSRTSRP